jgi:hypothetical protein
LDIYSSREINSCITAVRDYSIVRWHKDGKGVCIMERLKMVIDLLEQAWQLEQQFMTEQPVSERDQAGTFENWARKDVVFHIETWNARLVENIDKGLHGGTPYRNDDYDAENAIIFKENQTKTWHEAMDFAKQAHSKLLGITMELGVEGLEGKDILPWQEDQPIWRNIVGNGYNHILIHIGEHYRGLGKMSFYADLVEKMALSTAGLDDSPAWQGNVLYNLACAHALTGQKEKALEELCDALRLNPGLVEWSRQDADLEPLHGEPAYKALYQE